MKRKYIYYLFFIMLAFTSITPFLTARRCRSRCARRPRPTWRANWSSPYNGYYTGLGLPYANYYNNWPYYNTSVYYGFGFGIGMPRIGYPIGFW